MSLYDKDVHVKAPHFDVYNLVFYGASRIRVAGIIRIIITKETPKVSAMIYFQKEELKRNNTLEEAGEVKKNEDR